MYARIQRKYSEGDPLCCRYVPTTRPLRGPLWVIEGVSPRFGKPGVCGEPACAHVNIIACHASAPAVKLEADCAPAFTSGGIGR